jgi:hypothetical protein
VFYTLPMRLSCPSRPRIRSEVSSDEAKVALNHTDNEFHYCLWLG